MLTIVKTPRVLMATLALVAASALSASTGCGTGAIAPAGTPYPATFNEPEPGLDGGTTGTSGTPDPTPSPSASTDPNVTPSPTPTPTGTPKPTPTPSVTPTPTGTPKPTPTPSVTPTPTPIPTVTPTPTPTPTGKPVTSDPGSGTLSGHVLLSTFTPQSATWTSEGGALVVTLWQSANACSKWTQGEEPSGGKLTLSMGATAASYAVGTGAQGTFDITDAKCASTIPSSVGTAGGGQEVLTAAPATATAHATGTYSLTFGVQTLTGTFDAAPCAVIADPPASLTCSP